MYFWPYTVYDNKTLPVFHGMTHGRYTTMQEAVESEIKHTSLKRLAGLYRWNTLTSNPSGAGPYQVVCKNFTGERITVCTHTDEEIVTKSKAM